MEKKPEVSLPSGYIILSLAFLLLLGLTVFFLRQPDPPPVEIVTPTPTLTPTPEPLGIYILGAVNSPGVYFLPLGSRVFDALYAAGGATSEADLTQVNLAARLHDEEQIYIPKEGEGTPVPILSTPTVTASISPSSSGETTGPININTASAAELETLPGIGPTLAQRIVDYRNENGPFKTIEEIIEVRGIGEGIFSDIQHLITVGS